MEIRKLKTSDYEAMLPLYEALDALHTAARPDYFRPRPEAYPREDFVAAAKDPDCLLLGAFTLEIRLVGILRATLWRESGMIKDLKTVCLDDIYVCPEYRRTGIGRKLFCTAEEWAVTVGARRLDLHVWEFNQEAIAMYRAMGMDYQRHVMEKSL